MSRLFDRIARRRAGRPERAGADERDAGAEQGVTREQPTLHDGDAGATREQTAIDAPAGGTAAGEESPEPPGFRTRSRLRRRARYLRRARGAALRDLGGLVFDQHRFDRRREDLVAGKVEALAALDRELRALERVLGEDGGMEELREAGLAGTCPSCGALFGTEAHYCAHCGAQVSERAAPAVLAPVRDDTLDDQPGDPGPDAPGRA